MPERLCNTSENENMKLRNNFLEYLAFNIYFFIVQNDDKFGVWIPLKLLNILNYLHTNKYYSSIISISSIGFVSSKIRFAIIYIYIIQIRNSKKKVSQLDFILFFIFQ